MGPLANNCRPELACIVCEKVHTGSMGASQHTAFMAGLVGATQQMVMPDGAACSPAPHSTVAWWTPLGMRPHVMPPAHVRATSPLTLMAA